MKITAVTVARLARTARDATRGQCGIITVALPGEPPNYTDTAADKTWTGPDAARKAAAFYAGVIEQAAEFVSRPVRQILAEVTDRHGAYVDDGRAAARRYARIAVQRTAAANAAHFRTIAENAGQGR